MAALVPGNAAHAGAPVDSAVPAMATAAIPFAPCQPDGVSTADNAIANSLRSAMNGRRLGSAVKGYHISCARAIVSNVRARGLHQRAAVIAVTTAITESTLHNYTVAVDHDSLGLFQQRPSQGWGRPGQVVEPRFATNAFLNAMIRKHPGNGWLTGDIGQICQRVQGSAFPL
ncbi:MAG: VCBS repeat-containing protein, partial [Actinoplanes sp.]